MFFRSLLKRIDWLHAWFGMTAGVFVLVVSWTGTIAVFLDVLEVWERPETPVIAKHAQIDVDATMRAAIAEHFGDIRPDQITAFLPTRLDPTLRLSASAPGVPVLNTIIAPGGDRVAMAGPGPARLITRLHTDLLLPAPIGVWLVGFSGIVALVLIVTGILLHRHIVRDLFALRLFRSRRIALHDIHTIVGTWSLPFFFLLSFSGAVLGFISIASMMVGQVAGEEAAELIAEESPATALSSASPAAITNLNSVIDAARFLERPFEPEGIQVEGWGTASAVITVRGEPTDQLVWRRRATFDGTSGELISPDLDAVNAPPLDAYAMMTPIHYGNFGGMFVRTLYFLIGVVVTFAMGVGLILWINKRGGAHAMLSRVAIGLSAGCLVATALIFPLDLLLRHVPESRIAWLQSALWISWLATVCLTVICRSWARSLATALGTCALLFASAGVLSGIDLLFAGEAGHRAILPSGLINVFFFALALLCGYCAKWTRLIADATVNARKTEVAATA